MYSQVSGRNRRNEDLVERLAVDTGSILLLIVTSGGHSLLYKKKKKMMQCSSVWFYLDTRLRSGVDAGSF